MKFQVGQTVRIIGNTVYKMASDKPLVPLGSIGTVIEIRWRYRNTVNEYCQYYVLVSGFVTDGSDLNYLYEDSSLTPVNN